MKSNSQKYILKNNLSHSLDTIAELCDEVLWLHEGKIKKIGKPDKIIEEYSKFMAI